MPFQIENNKNFAENLERLDQSQAAAVKSTSEDVVIRAGAGSGKTSTLITAIADYRLEHPNHRICAITYTRAARAEMENRLRDMGIYDVEVTTIHVWSRNLLDYFASRYDFRIQILQEPQIKSILEEITKQYLRHSRVRSVNIGILYTYITGSKTMDITDNYRRTLNALEERYIHYKEDNHLYDFTDYPKYLWDVLEEYNEYICNIDALFVDEFQDVDSTQFKIFERVNTNKKFYIGDPWQSIFIFRGADGEVFNKLGNFDLFKLKYNYRSFQEIIDYATTVYSTLQPLVEDDLSTYITSVTYSTPSNIECARKYGGNVYIITPREETFHLNNQQRIVENTYKVLNDMLKKNPMFLCRTNKQVRALQDLGIDKVSTVHQAKGLEYDDIIVVDSTIESSEDLNIAYVALTRAKNNLLVINWGQLESFLRQKHKTEALRYG